jgi:hypothetical protein
MSKQGQAVVLELVIEQTVVQYPPDRVQRSSGAAAIALEAAIRKTEERAALKIKRSEAAKRGWETRRANEAAFRAALEEEQAALAAAEEEEESGHRRCAECGYWDCDIGPFEYV